MFLRGDLAGSPAVPALLSACVPAERRTALALGGARVDTVEHLLAAILALDIADVWLVVHGPELPILDGSFAPFTELLDRAGVVEAEGSAAGLELAEGFEMVLGEGRYRIEPAAELTVDVTLEFAEPVIGHQHFCSLVTDARFRREIAPARTFGLRQEVERLQSQGQMLGASEACGIALAPERVLNTALRWPNEFARHKAGDLIGDLALLGARPRVAVTAERPSHAGNLACARAIAARAHFVEG